tara:strand:+ start:3655 stop:4866 length:1212 start_codon:yes stop_codon:yes gene_type:complete
MAEVIKMPRLSDTMTDGVVVKWHRKIGDKVSEGDLLADIETDKATMEFESFQEGVLLHIGVKENETAEVDSILAILGDKDEDITSLLDVEQTTKIQPKEQVTNQDLSTPKVVENIDVKKDFYSSIKDKNRIKISPLAKKIAQEKNLDLSLINGTGDGGRIIKRDVENNSENLALQTPNEETIIPVSQMRKTIAKRLSQSKFTAPHFYLNMEVDMDELIKSRKLLNEKNDIKISFNDILVKAVAMALKKHPVINSSWLGDSIKNHNNINIGVAVSLTNGLVVPVIRNADKKTCTDISLETNLLVQKARDNKLQPQDWDSNTFTISNLGMYKIDDFTAIINAPDACILAVGAIKERPVVKNGSIQVANIMRLTLSCDHRLVDGVEGAKFLNTLKSMLETPLMMLY